MCIFFCREDDEYPDYASRRAAERAERRAEQKRQERQARKAQEMAQEEIYDKMMNPHLYGGGGGGGYRKIKPGEHYEEVQKKELEKEIMMKEREERMRHRELERREHDRARRHHTDPYGGDRRLQRHDQRGYDVGGRGRYQREFYDDRR